MTEQKLLEITTKLLAEVRQMRIEMKSNFDASTTKSIPEKEFSVEEARQYSKSLVRKRASG